VSQSVIITRMAGRTPVPERESGAQSRERAAPWWCSLVRLLEELQAELLQGAYTGNTPCRARLQGHLAGAAGVALHGRHAGRDRKARAGITQDGARAGGRLPAAANYERSKLYDPSFTTGFRTGASHELA
jgi:precorrin-4/cobalt-precorrin-4 C11-methyltransferase